MNDKKGYDEPSVSYAKYYYGEYAPFRNKVCYAICASRVAYEYMHRSGMMQDELHYYKMIPIDAILCICY